MNTYEYVSVCSFQNDIFSPIAKIFDMTAGPVRELFRTSNNNNNNKGIAKAEEEPNAVDDEVITAANLLVVLNDREIMDGGGSRTKVEEEEPLRIVDGSVHIVTGFPVRQSSVEEFLFEDDDE